MRNRLLSITRGSIPFVKELKPYLKSTNAVLLMQQHEYWFERYPEGFYKFQQASPKNSLYRDGDSWCEELEFSIDELKGAWLIIGVSHKSPSAYKDAANKFLRPDGSEAYYCSVYDRLTHRIRYYRNDLKVDMLLDDLCNPHNGHCGNSTIGNMENPQSGIGEFHIRYTDTTTDTTFRDIDHANDDPIGLDSQDENKTPDTSKQSADVQTDLAPAACANVEKPKRSRKPKDPEVPKHDPEAFATLKEQYWGTIDPVKSATQWDKLKPNAELVATIFHFVAEAKEGIWKDQDPRFIQYLHTFLRDHGWKVQYKKPSAPPPSPKRTQAISEDEQMEYLRSYL